MFSVLTHTPTNCRKLKKQGLTYLLEHGGYWLASKAETVARWLASRAEAVARWPQACELKLSHGEKNMQLSRGENVAQ